MEVEDITHVGGIVELADGSWLLAQEATGRTCTDGGRTWRERDLGAPLSVGGLIRLRCGALAIYGSRAGGTYFASSPDEGRTWSEPALVSDYPDFTPMFHSMIQLASGRLLLSGYCGGGLYGWDYRDGTMVSVHPDLQYDDVMAYGSWRGRKIALEGHGHGPEIGMTVVHRSDDEGRTWTKHPGALMGWFDFEGIPNGSCGVTSCFEPTLAQGPHGHVLLLMRSTVGRLVQSFSTDGGESWCAVRPSELPSSESPGIMAALPGTGDLLLVWNQVSREEIRRGHRRCRLSSAISRDGGHSWANFKTLELSEGLEDMDRVGPESPIRMVRARDRVGPLPDGWGYFHYANLDVVGDRVILRYLRGSPLLGVAEQNLQKQESVLRVYPIAWFYE